MIKDVDGDFTIPPLEDVLAMALSAARLTNPDCVCAGICVNTSKMREDDRSSYLSGLQKRFGVPAVDPVATGIGPIADFLLQTVNQTSTAAAARQDNGQLAV